MLRFPPFVRPLLGVSNLVAVASGKGGVGKTTVTVNLALALARLGASVGVYDADLYGPNVPVLLGVTRKTGIPGYLPVARADATPYIPPLTRFGLKVMSIGFFMGTDDPVTPPTDAAGAIIRQTLQDVQWGQLDYLLIDLPPGTGEPQQTLLETIPMKGVVIVTTPQDLALMDASRSLAFFRKSSAPILGVVENMSYLVCPHCGEPIEVFHRSDQRYAIEAAEIDLLGRIPLNLAVSRPIEATHPLLAENPLTAEATIFLEIAQKIRARLPPHDLLAELDEP
ncbi:MAG: P-loop NTPase [Caldilineaceae bacterium]|nr:P-loop NTPase [Caldilineaceae bacterium]